MAAVTPAEIVMCRDGYFDDDQAVLSSLRACRPDIVVVGMGMPHEAKWTFQCRGQLPPAVVLTCGGWFGFLAGEERRAPKVLQKAGLEWTYRLMQDFPRLSSRYSRGALAVASLLPGQLRRRSGGR